jgi:AraC-like DNA-binding protein
MAPEERAEVIREITRRQLGRVKVGVDEDPTRISIQMSGNRAGPVDVSAGVWSPLTIQRKMDAAHENIEPYVVANLQVSGTSTVVQAGREVVLQPGSFCIHDNTRPFAFSNSEPAGQITVNVPRTLLAMPSSVLDRAPAQRIGPGHPTVEAATAYFSRLAGGVWGDDRDHALLAQPSIELVRALVATALGREDLAAEPLHMTLQQRVMTYLRLHLADRDLSAARIAAEHHISERQLYLVLSRAGISLGEWIRSQRLEACRRELASARGEHATIQSIAGRWGFVSAPHFSRVFKQTYGVSPRQWRTESRAAGKVGLSTAQWESPVPAPAGTGTELLAVAGPGGEH